MPGRRPCPSPRPIHKTFRLLNRRRVPRTAGPDRRRWLRSSCVPLRRSKSQLAWRRRPRHARSGRGDPSEPASSATMLSRRVRRRDAHAARAQAHLGRLGAADTRREGASVSRCTRRAPLLLSLARRPGPAMPSRSPAVNPVRRERCFRGLVGLRQSDAGGSTCVASARERSRSVPQPSAQVGSVCCRS